MRIRCDLDLVKTEIAIETVILLSTTLPKDDYKLPCQSSNSGGKFIQVCKEFVRNLTENANITYAIFRNVLVNTLVCNESVLVKFTLKKNKVKQKKFIHRIFPA